MRDGQGHGGKMGDCGLLLFEFANDGAVETVAEVLDGGHAGAEHDGRLVVGQLALGLRVTVVSTWMGCV